MKTFYLITIAAIVIFCSSAFGQDADLTKLIEETQLNEINSAKTVFLEFVHDWKRSSVDINGKRQSQTYEIMCSNKHCESIQVEQDGKDFDEKKLRKNREKAAKNFEKSENKPDSNVINNLEIYGYGIYLGSSIYDKNYNSFASPLFYLKNCQTDFVENQTIENRFLIKLHSYNCNIESAAKKESLKFMPKSEAVILIDKADKVVVKIELYSKAENEPSINFGKPLVTLEKTKIPEGFWFWNKIIINGIGNGYFFENSIRNWQIDFFNYKKFNVDIDKAEVNKKSN